MAVNSNFKLDSNQLGTNPAAAPLTDNNNWMNWNERSGDAVQRFIKEQLASSVQDITYDSTSHELQGLNAFGDKICSTEIVNTDPLYDMEFAINSVYVNKAMHTNGVSIPYSDYLNVEVGITLKMWFTVVNSTAIKTPQKIYFYIKNDPTTILESDPIIPQNIDDTEELLVPITELFTKSNASSLTNAILCAKIVPNIDQIQEQTVEYPHVLNVIKLNLEYNQDQVVYGRVSYDISGIPEGASNYNLNYYVYSLQEAQRFNTASNTAIPTSSIPISAGATNCSINIPEDPGVYLIFARLQNTDASITSNWLQTNVINTSATYNGQALIGVNNITSQFLNCDSSKLYDISVVAGAGGSVEIKSYIATTTANVISEENLYKTNSFNNLSSQDTRQDLSVWSYNELTNITENTSRYIGIQVVIEGITYILKRFYVDNYGRLKAYDYYPITVVENSGNVNNSFNYTTNSQLDFSQITSTNNEVFKKDNIDPSLIPSDGYYQEEKRLVYKVSPQYTNSNEGLFINPINLNPLVNSNFTLDIIYASENTGDDQASFSIGNLIFGPGYMYLKGDEQDSLVSFQKEAYTHLIITYSSGYKPQTYPNTYKDFFPSYDLLDSCAYNVLKIYVNGGINREIELSGISDLGNFLFQIHPTTSTLKMQQFRTYNFALSYNQIQKNTISGLLNSSDKISYYTRNSILKEDGTISFYKALKTNNVLIHILPHGTTPVWYGQKEVSGSALLVHYKDPTYKAFNGRFVGEKENGMVYKNQGSSANKYMFHNTAVQKFAFQSDESISNGTANRDQTYYLMPNDTETRITKLVGKVNYASSMQSHKPGSCATFHDVYTNLINSNDSEFNSEPKLYTGGRKAVNELPFLYFYYVLEENDDRNPEDIKLSDLYSVSTDVLGNETIIEKDVKFFGFQTWGSAKGDPATSGYDEKKTPEYLLMEGADNYSLGANFKQPWAALQSKGNTTTSITKNDRFTGLVIDDKTITYEEQTDPWDIDFGCADDKQSFTDGVKKSVNIFADFCDAMYLYDFLNLRGITEAEIPNLTADDAKYKYYLIENGRTYKQFDVIRYDQKDSQWVPGGLQRTGTVWDTFNLKTYLQSFGSSTDPLIQYVIANPPIINNVPIDYNIPTNETDVNSVMSDYVIPYFKALFERAVEVYTDIEDVAYHQAFIKVITGTDNRAKNTYFQIIGHIYSDKLTINGTEITLVKTSDNKIGYIQDSLFYEVDIETASVLTEGIDASDLEYTSYYYDTGQGDYKIRLLADDLDTIFATNNNGQQVIPSYVIEPVFNPNFENWWNDRNNALWYHFDLLYEDKIYKYVQIIIEYLIGNSASIHNSNSNLYKNYFSIQNGFPEIAYNHHAEIYYELANLMFYETLRAGLDADTKAALDLFGNNGVEHPLSLSHGRCVESEYQFLEERLVMLGSLCDIPQATALYKGDLLLNTSTGGVAEQIIIEADVTSNTYVAPIKASSSGESSRIITYTLGDILPADNILLTTIYNNRDTSIRSICNLMTPTSPQVTMTIPIVSNIEAHLRPTDSFKTVIFNSGLTSINTFPSFKKATHVEIDGATGYRCSTSGTITVSDRLQLIETLKLTNVPFTGTSVVLDFRECNKLKTLDLSGCTGLQGIIIPSNKYLTSLILPDGLEIIQLGFCQSLNYADLVINNNRFNSITIDGRNSFVSNFIEDFVVGFNGLLTITNSETLALTYQALTILANLENLTFIGVKHITVPEMHFQVKFKLYRHKSFQNITISGYPTISYKSIEFAPDPYIISQGTSDNYLSCLDFIDNNGVSANNIEIGQLSFSINSVQGITLGKDLCITVTSSVVDNTEVTLTVKYQNRTVASPILKVGFNVPKLGDFAYADGSFSPKYNPSKTIGYVYKCEEIGSSKTYQVSIMALNPIETSQLGYSEQRYYTQGKESELYNIITKYPARTDIGQNKHIVDLFPKSSNNPYVINNIIATTSLNVFEGVDETLEDYENGIMEDHLISALKNYYNLAPFCSHLNLDINIESIVNNKTYDSKNQIINMLDQMKGKSYTYKNPNNNDSYTADISPILFPAYLKTYAYVPSLCDINSQNGVVKKYVNSPWKIPSTYTVAYLVKEIAKSALINNNNRDSWTTTQFHQNTVAAYRGSLFSTIAQNISQSDLSGVIGFVGSSAKMTSEHAVQHPIYTNYSYHSYSSGATIYVGISADTSNWYTENSYGLRSDYYSGIYPCITILISKDDYANN